MNPIHPVTAAVFSPANSSVNAQIPDAAGAQVMFYNSGSVNAYFKYSPTTAPTAAATDFVLPPGAIMTFSRRAGDAYLAIYSTGTLAVYVTYGEGS